MSTEYIAGRFLAIDSIAYNGYAQNHILSAHKYPSSRNRVLVNVPPFPQHDISPKCRGCIAKSARRWNVLIEQITDTVGDLTCIGISDRE